MQDPLNKYISDYPNGDKIKIYNLLTHTSGISEYLKIVDSLESGSIPGYTTFIERNVDKKYMIIILSNKEFNKSVHNIQLGLSQLLEN